MRQHSALWPRRPRPLPQESFASWFARLAWQNGLSPARLYTAALPGGRMYRLDLDRYADPLLIKELADRTGVPARDLWEQTLRRWCGSLYETDDGSEKLLWLPPAGTSLSRRSFGQQVCPACLKEDEEPYLRADWRIAFLPACPRHACLLVDRCSQCGEPIQPLYSSPAKAGVATCWHCGSDLAGDQSPSVSADALALLDRLREAAVEGWFPLGSTPRVHALAGFRILWTIYRLLATGRFAYPLRHWLAEQRLSDEPVAGIPRLKEIERLKPRHRVALLRMASVLLEEWPDRFVAACREKGITSRALVKTRAETPFALWHVANHQLCDPPRDVTKEELEEAKRYLERRGTAPTYKALVDLLGVKFTAHRGLSAPAGKRKNWGTDRYWKLDGVSPAVRAAAKRAAKRQGENVGPWVERALREILEREQLL